MKILALDLGTRTGWAIHRPAMPEPISGTMDFTTKRWESPAVRFLHFRQSIPELLFEIDHVVYERVHRHAGTDAAHFYGGLLAELQVACLERNLPFEGFTPGQIKKHATGKGNADKDAMIAAASARWPQQLIRDDNQADALWLLDLARATYANLATR